MILQELIKTLGSSQVLWINVRIVNPLTDEEINICISDIDLTGEATEEVTESLYSLKSFCAHARKLGLYIFPHYILVAAEYEEKNK